MKRMVYILLSVVGIILAVIISVGCVYTPADNQKQLSGISLSQRSMSYADSYSFFLRKENGKVLFDADVRFNEEPCEIIIEGYQIDDKYFDEIMNFDKEYGVSDYVESYKKKPVLFHAVDKTENSTTVYYTDGTDKTADAGAYKDELYDFFAQLALTYRNCSVTEAIK